MHPYVTENWIFPGTQNTLDAINRLDEGFKIVINSDFEGCEEFEKVLLVFSLSGTNHVSHLGEMKLLFSKNKI